MENCVAPGLDEFDVLLEVVLSLVRVLAHILSPVNDNSPTGVSGRERMAVESISWPNLHERMFRRTGLT